MISRSRPFLTAALLASAPLAAADWSQVMGPRHDRKSEETVNAKWPAGGPRKVWEIPAERGFSSFVTGGGRAYTVVGEPAGGDTREVAVAVDRKTGATLWRTPLGKVDYANGGNRGVPGNDGGDGPRTTPVFAGGKVFVFGAEFDLHALDDATGKTVWSRDLKKEFKARDIHWSNSASPLVMGDRVIVAGGGEGQSYLAFKAADGELVWKSGTDKPTYTTPVLATLHGKAQVLFMAERGIVAIDPADGRELWHYPFPYRTATAVSPVVWNDLVHCTAGYGVGGAACRVTRAGDKWEVTEVWRSPGNRDSASHWMTPVVHDGYLYGCYGHGEYGRAALKCIDIRTGEVKWSQSGFGHGATIMVGGKLLAISDAGRLVLVEPTPTAYRELAATKAIDGKVWASLAYSDGHVLLRSTTKGVCLEL